MKGVGAHRHQSLPQSAPGGTTAGNAFAVEQAGDDCLVPNISSVEAAVEDLFSCSTVTGLAAPRLSLPEPPINSSQAAAAPNWQYIQEVCSRVGRPRDAQRVEAIDEFAARISGKDMFSQEDTARLWHVARDYAAASRSEAVGLGQTHQSLGPVPLP